MTTFTKTTPGGHDPATDRFTGPSSSSVTGSAIKVRSTAAEEARYQAMGLLLQEVITLFFTPDVYGETPQVGSTVVWAGEEYTVRTVDTIAPDGVTIAARIGATG